MDNTVSYGHILNWSLGLLVVLCLFFACVWFMRKMGVLSISPKQSMRVVTGLSLGVREKLVLVQVGDRQLVLGVTPGRIDNLLVLEGDDQLFLDKSGSEEKNEFSLKLKQVMAGTGNE
ncbi:MAG: flagellar biosynthetic protein FliO [Methylococcales bacterium]|nr:flagellar biosynthetic protein FliO [Methylococcales bacterium]